MPHGRIRRTLTLAVGTGLFIISITATAHASPTSSVRDSQPVSSRRIAEPNIHTEFCSAGPCLVFDPAETAQIANANTNGIITAVASACSKLSTPPAQIICGGIGAIDAVGLNQIAKLAVDRNGCAALILVNPTVPPVPEVQKC